ncbi:hypothetical protein GQ44DRAFT_599253, partial [Phaeosphaeriaceae sp. PMI808]
EAQKLSYLRAVINEALRIHPAVGQPMFRLIGKNGAYIASKYFPPGNELGISPWVIHRNAYTNGTGASQF